jgi:hypothetical protein
MHPPYRISLDEKATECYAKPYDNLPHCKKSSGTDSSITLFIIAKKAVLCNLFPPHDTAFHMITGGIQYAAV